MFWFFLYYRLTLTGFQCSSLQLAEWIMALGKLTFPFLKFFFNNFNLTSSLSRIMSLLVSYFSNGDELGREETGRLLSWLFVKLLWNLAVVNGYRCKCFLSVNQWDCATSFYSTWRSSFENEAITVHYFQAIANRRTTPTATIALRLVCGLMGLGYWLSLISERHFIFKNWIIPTSHLKKF